MKRLVGFVVGCGLIAVLVICCLVLTHKSDFGRVFDPALITFSFSDDRSVRIHDADTVSRKTDNNVLFQTGSSSDGENNADSVGLFKTDGTVFNSVTETEYSKKVKQVRQQIAKDWEGVDSPEVIVGDYAIVGGIKSSKEISDFVEGKKGNPLKTEARQLINSNNNIATLGPTKYEESILQEQSANNENSLQTKSDNWGTPGIVQANINVETGNMLVSCGSNGYGVEYLNNSTLLSQSNNSLIYNIGGNDKRIIMGMDQFVEELILKSDQVPGSYDVWYKLTLQKWVKYIDIAIDGYIEFRDGNDQSLMKVAKPKAIDVNGNAVQCSWSIENIQAETVLSVLKNGSSQAWEINNGVEVILKLSVNMTGAAYPVVIDPAWSTGGGLGTASKIPGVFQLSDGKILKCGGMDDASILSTCELYDPATGVWSSTGSMATARYYFAGVVRPNSNVLVTGGYTANQFLQSCELFDPATATWSGTGSMSSARTLHTLTLLADSDTALATGGWIGITPYIRSCEKWASGTWTVTGSLGDSKRIHCSILLQNDKVLAIGGDTTGGRPAIAVCELYDASAGTWAVTGSLNTGRRHFVATMLTNGDVVAFSGKNDSDTIITTCEKYTTASGTWTYTGSITTGRSGAGATMLPSGKVLITGGYDGAVYQLATEIFDSTTFSAGTGASVRRANHGTVIMYDSHILTFGGQNAGGAVASTEYYRNIDGTWTNTGSMSAARRGGAMIVANNGKILTAGGITGPTATCELYDTSTGTWTLTGSFTARYGHAMVNLQNGKIMTLGGWDSGAVEIATVELYDVSAGTWATTGSLVGGTSVTPAVVLTNGNVISIGGYLGGSALPHCQLYDNGAGTWALTGSLNSAGKYSHGAVILSNGKILTAGGVGSTQTSELYQSATWTLTGSLGTGRSYHQLIYLPNGKVLACGGGTAVSELYNVSAGTWANTGSLNTSRQFNAAALLANGKILVTGGDNAAAGVTCEIFDPATGTWAYTGSMTGTRQDMGISLLPTGKVLVMGGFDSASNLLTCELYDPIGSLASSTQPTISSVEGSSSFPVSITKSGTIDIVGTNFKGKTEGSSGKFNSSSAAFPIVQLKRVTDESSAYFGGSSDAIFLPVSSSWTASTSLTFTAPSGLQDNAFYQLRVIVNGIMSDAKIVKAIP